MAFENEAAFEAALINLLTEKYGWEPLATLERTRAPGYSYSKEVKLIRM